MNRRRKSVATGFTLIELLVVVVVIGIIAAIAMPNYIGAQAKAKLAAVKNNMHTLQICAESYSTDGGGVYGPDTTSLLPYLPGGGHSHGGAPGAMFKNPFTSQNNGTSAATATSVADVTAERSSSARIASASPPGDVGYSGFNSGTPGGALDTYAVDGADDVGSLVMGSGGHLVLSNGN